jgi:hypothetical protein
MALRVWVPKRIIPRLGALSAVSNCAERTQFGEVKCAKRSQSFDCGFGIADCGFKRDLRRDAPAVRRPEPLVQTNPIGQSESWETNPIPGYAGWGETQGAGDAGQMRQTKPN